MSSLSSNRSSLHISSKPTKSSLHAPMAARIQLLKDSDHLSVYQQRTAIAYQIPSTQDYATIHRRAHTFGYLHQVKNTAQLPVCPCCFLPIHGQELSMNTGTTPAIEDYILLQSFYLDGPPALFFTIIKYSLMYLMAVILTVSIFAISMSLINNHYCLSHQSLCGHSKFIQYSPAKQAIKGHLYLLITDILNLIMVVLSLLFFRYVRKVHRDINRALSYHNQTQEEYTLLVTNVPRLIQTEKSLQFDFKEVLKQFFEEKVKSFFKAEEQEELRFTVIQKFREGVIQNNRVDPLSMDIVTSISLCHDLSDLQRLQTYRKELSQQLQKKPLQEDTRLLKQQAASYQSKLTILNQQYFQLCQSYQRSSNWTLSRFLGIALISFQFQHYRHYLIELYKAHPEQFKISNQQIALELAPKPENIEWSNLNLTWEDKIRQILYSYSLLISLVVFCFLAVDAINKQIFQAKILKFPSRTVPQIPSFWQLLLTPSIIYLTTYVLRKMGSYLNQRERHPTTTRRQIAKLFKYLISTVLNTTVIFFILSLMQGGHYLLDNGIVVLTSYYMVPIGIISVLVNLFSLQHMIESIPKSPSNPLVTTQINYNKKHEPMQFDISQRYAYYLATIYLALFYAYINPLCVVAALLSLFCHYWIDKYTLFKRSAILPVLGHQYSNLTLQLFQLSVLFFAGGNFYFSWKIQGQVTNINLGAFLLACLYTFIVTLFPGWAERVFCGLKRNYETDSYSHCVQTGKLFRNYWQSNPATMLTEEPNLNKKGQFITYNLSYRLADRRDVTRSNSASYK